MTYLVRITRTLPMQRPIMSQFRASSEYLPDVRKEAVQRLVSGTEERQTAKAEIFRATAWGDDLIGVLHYIKPDRPLIWSPIKGYPYQCNHDGTLGEVALRCAWTTWP